ncbi:MAG: asparaginase [Synergistetes bacterium]|nr:MAG: L-asparaginase/GlutRNAGln amidotransferase subunit D [bacterium 42_11]MBC7331083.1 asparaginase [Synergistota bacterium]
MDEADDGGFMPRLKGIDLVSKLPKLPPAVSEVDVREWKLLPSAHLSAKDVLELVFLIRELSKGYDGIVVTHGTDALEETAYMVDLLYGGSTPVVFTGAMYPLSFPGSDALRNLYNAIRVASCFDAIGQGVLVVMNDEIHAASEIIKLKSFGIDAFSSFPFGFLGSLTPNGVEFRRKLLEREFYEVDSIEERVALLKVYFSMDSSIMDLLISADYKGVVIEGMGVGNVPPSLVPSLERAIDKGMVVVLASRCPGSDVVPFYSYEGGSLNLVNKGAIPAGKLNGLKARIKLMVLLGVTQDLEEIRDRFS